MSCYEHQRVSTSKNNERAVVILQPVPPVVGVWSYQQPLPVKNGLESLKNISMA